MAELPDWMPVSYWGYLKASLAVKRAGYGSDLDWAQRLLTRAETADDTYVMSETAWVICCSGFRVQVVRKFWPRLTKAFLHWWPPSICACAGSCRRDALTVYGHQGKIGAIIAVAEVLNEEGCAQLITDAIIHLSYNAFPSLGRSPATTWPRFWGATWSNQTFIWCAQQRLPGMIRHSLYAARFKSTAA